ncbi:MAG: thioredoxin family protein [Oscillospiraceae bacterium]|nr:thioredoxin family protein [Oscillospiraceae bacterium]MCL2279341.1 thioredoxin family protein [Oscillospiraceae bacterium]
MSYFDDNSIDQIKQVMERISGDVSICAVLEFEGELSEKIREFLCEFSEVTDRVPINIYYKGDNVEVEEKIGTSIFPVIALMHGDGLFSGVSFHGIPAGHELESFVLAIYNVAGPGQPISDSLLDRIKSLDKPINVKVGVNLSCTMCPELVQVCQRIAAVNENISAAMLDLQHFPKMRKQYRVMSVPVIIINDEKTVFGKKSIEEVLELLM